MDSTNILYGKKWAVCGDSFTNGDFSGGYSETFENGPFAGKYKTYGYLIAERNQMTVQHLAVGKKVAYGPDAAYYPGYSAGGDSALVDGVIGGWTYGDRRWQGFIDKKRMDVTIDMEKETEIHSVGADFMQVCGPEVFMPSEVIISVSNDGKEFTELKRMEHKVVKDDKVTFINFGWEGNAKARYIRYQASSGEFGGFLFTDEIVVK